MYNTSDIGWILESMLIHKKMDMKGIVKSNFVISCLGFRGLILTFTTLIVYVDDIIIRDNDPMKM